MKEAVKQDSLERKRRRATYKSLYRSKLLDCNQWIRKSANLLECAAIIRPHVIRTYESWEASLKDSSQRCLSDKYIAVYFMLAGYAIENLLKARIIRKNRRQLDSELGVKGRFPAHLASHDLVSLAKKAGIDVGVAEEQLLRRLTRSATWYARYPVPLHPSKLWNEVFCDGKEYNIAYFTRTDLATIEQMLDSMGGLLSPAVCRQDPRGSPNDPSAEGSPQ